MLHAHAVSHRPTNPPHQGATMGAGTSTVAAPFEVFLNWDKDKAEAIIDEYKQKDYDFGIDAATTSMLLGVDLQVSKNIISKMSRSGTGIINALSLISGIIVVSNVIDTKDCFELVFDVFDFDSSGNISMDEMTILLLSASKAMHVVTNSSLTEPSDPGMERITVNAFKDLNLELGAFITKESFVAWGMDYVKTDSNELNVAKVLNILTAAEASIENEDISISVADSVGPSVEQAPAASTVTEEEIAVEESKAVEAAPAEVEENAPVASEEKEDGKGEAPVADPITAEEEVGAIDGGAPVAVTEDASAVTNEALTMEASQAQEGATPADIGKEEVAVEESKAVEAAPAEVEENAPVASEEKEEGKGEAPVADPLRVL